MRVAMVSSALLLLFLPPSVSHLRGAPNLPAWGMPSNLGPVINSPFVEAGPAMSKNGLSLYFHSNRPGGLGDNDIWVSQRASIHDPWGPPVNVGPTINTSFAETVPTLSRDQHWMFLASTRPGGEGGNDIWVSWREHTHDDFGWQAPVNLGPNINTAFFDAGLAFFEGDGVFPATVFFVSNKPGGIGGNDIYQSELLPDGSFGPSVHLPELNSPLNDARPTISHDGLEMIFFSNRSGTFGGNDFWVSTRASLGSAWTAAANLGAVVNGASDEFQPQLSGDSELLLFASNRPGGLGDFDLYASVRSRPGR